jgi:CRP/FNR family cyclic AMP-dependent transcriptional regulator
MPNDIWSPFAEGQSPQDYKPGQLIYLQDTEATQFYYILSGSVKCFISSESGDERTLTVHRAGDLMGEAAFFDEQPRVSSAVALTRCEIISITKKHLTAIFAAHPELAISMLQYLARTVRLLSEHVDDMSFLQADQRIARHLLSLDHGSGELSCTHEELGTAVSASRVTVSRVLGEFSRRGWIETGYRTVRILNPAALSNMFSHD